MTSELKEDFLYFLKIDLPIDQKVLDKFVEYENYVYKGIHIDPREWIEHPDNETQNQKINRYEHQLYNTIIRMHTYPYQSKLDISNEQERETRARYISINQQIDTFNSQVLSIVMHQYYGINYPSRDDVDRFLVEMNLPTRLNNTSTEEQFQLRKNYPYAWLSSDIPFQWLYNQDNVVEMANRESLITANKLPNEIALFRVSNIDVGNLKIGESIIDLNSQPNNYLYHITKANSSCCILFVKYPKNHKFIMPVDSSGSPSLNFIGYPGEILFLTNKIFDGNKTIIFADFYGYEDPPTDFDIEQVIIKKLGPYQMMKPVLRDEKPINADNENIANIIATQKRQKVNINGHDEDFWLYVLEYDRVDLLRSIINIWFKGLNDNLPLDSQLNFLYYMLIDTDEDRKTPYQIKSKLLPYEIEYLSKLSPAKLRGILGETYKGPSDHASLLYTALTSRVTNSPDISNFAERYKLISHVAFPLLYYVKKASKLAYKLYPPHIAIASSDPSIIEPIILRVNSDNIFEFMDYYGVVQPGPVDDKVIFFLDEIIRYNFVLTRDVNFKPPNISDYTRDTRQQLRRQLLNMTTAEILDNYVYKNDNTDEYEWRTRISLVNSIVVAL